MQGSGLRRVLMSGGLAAVIVLLLYVLSHPLGSLPAPGSFLDPVDGVYRTARGAEYPAFEHSRLPGLSDEVTVYRDERGVPHIYAQNRLDAISALAYVTAQDRLFQMLVAPRVATGRLSEYFGPTAIETDRFLRRTGMPWSVRNATDRILVEGGLELEIAEAYVRGANAYIANLSPRDYPFEYRLLGLNPEPLRIEDVFSLNQYLALDLSYTSDFVELGFVRESLGHAYFDLLFPEKPDWYVPSVPDNVQTGLVVPPTPDATAFAGNAAPIPSDVGRRGNRPLPAGSPVSGSNAWAVGPERSTTGGALLAGDPHLTLFMPSLWYEARMVTPHTNVYGITVPGAPVFVIGFNEHLGWSATNAATDQIDHYRLQLNSAGNQYRYDERWLDIDFQPDTIRVRGVEPVIDSLMFSHWGPIQMRDGEPVAIQWMNHRSHRTFRAFMEMNEAADMETFENALRNFGDPPQNIVYADIEGNIMFRTAGAIPVRQEGTGSGLLDGSSRAGDWIGTIPFEDLPHTVNPEQGYVLSANQRPVNHDYPYYLGRMWASGFRSIRIDSLLSRSELHSPEDFRAYQSDVYVIWREPVVQALARLDNLGEREAALVRYLQQWNGLADTDSPEMLIIDELMVRLEQKVVETLDLPLIPRRSNLLHALFRDPDGRIEGMAGFDAGYLLRESLEATAEALEDQFGWDSVRWRWGDHHKIYFDHLLQDETLHGLSRGPFEYPGAYGTVSPAEARLTTKSASWRFIVDFSESPPRGWGIHPGGPSGNPFSRFYDFNLDTYLDFGYFRLENPADSSQLSSVAQLTLHP